MIRDDLAHAVRRALADAGLPEPPERRRARPARSSASTATGPTPVALAAREARRRAARSTIAARIAAALEAARRRRTSSGSRSRGPGFVNLYLAPTWLHDVLRDGRRRGRRVRARPTRSPAQRINLEFVSANPTGPLHAGGGRWVAVGDAIANLLAAQGAEVHREYYLNDAGNQLDTFARVAATRATGARQPPEDGYQGEYLVEMADAACAPSSATTCHRRAGARVGLPRVVDGLRRTTSSASACTSTPGSPSARCTSAARSPRVLDELDERGRRVRAGRRRAGCAPTDFGDQRDRVLVKSDGTTTYLCNDLAYHRDKFARGLGRTSSTSGAPTTTAR